MSPYFVNRSVAFFEDIARALPHAIAADEERDVYPRVENRKIVALHLRRERSRFLALERKAQDNYQCQVCDLRFEDVYGTFGAAFAEAHHLIPLSLLHNESRTEIDDLATVCANCHRMLHRMAGERTDLTTLRALVRNRAAKQGPFDRGRGDRSARARRRMG